MTSPYESLLLSSEEVESPPQRLVSEDFHD
jgi:hypothetical protein